MENAGHIKYAHANLRHNIKLTVFKDEDRISRDLNITTKLYFCKTQ